MGPAHSSTNSTPWEPYSIQRCYHRDAENQYIQRTRKHCSTRYPFIPGSRERKYLQVRCLARGTHRQTSATGSVPEIYRWEVAGRSHLATTPWMLMDYYSDMGTLMVVTTRELNCRFRGFVCFAFYIPFQCQWDGTAMYVVMWATKGTQSPTLKVEK